MYGPCTKRDLWRCKTKRKQSAPERRASSASNGTRADARAGNGARAESAASRSSPLRTFAPLLSSVLVYGTIGFPCRTFLALHPPCANAHKQTHFLSYKPEFIATCLLHSSPKMRKAPKGLVIASSLRCVLLSGCLPDEPDAGQAREIGRTRCRANRNRVIRCQPIKAPGTPLSSETGARNRTSGTSSSAEPIRSRRPRHRRRQHHQAGWARHRRPGHP